MVFFEDEDQKRFLELLGETSRQWKIEMFAYCFLDNHYHILLQTSGAGAFTCHETSRWDLDPRFNQVHHPDGPLFQGRYKASLIDAGFGCVRDTV
jgi:REP-associated tyrosine transposase